MNKRAFLRDAAVISAGGFVAKAMGAAYRIPLMALIGSIGLGVYQMVYPLYAIMLTLTSSALPSALSRLISSGRHPRAHIVALRLYVPLSVAPRRAGPRLRRAVVCSRPRSCPWRSFRP